MRKDFFPNLIFIDALRGVYLVKIDQKSIKISSISFKKYCDQRPVAHRCRISVHRIDAAHESSHAARREYLLTSRPSADLSCLPSLLHRPFALLTYNYLRIYFMFACLLSTAIWTALLVIVLLAMVMLGNIHDREL